MMLEDIICLFFMEKLYRERSQNRMEHLTEYNKQTKQADDRETGAGMRRVTWELLEQYKRYLYAEEKAGNTIAKYMCDLKKFMEYSRGQEVTKEMMIAYKEYLLKERHYKVASINSYIVAVNRFFEYMGWYGICVKTLKIQRDAYCQEEKELMKTDYKKLVKTAKEEGKYRLAMIIQTICATGIRVSELSAVTVKSVQKGVIEVNNKGKIRRVLIHNKLRRQLLAYASRRGISRGLIFCTKSGKPVHRNNIWRDMKQLCKKAGVNAEKVYPHNLRHLFAKSFYEVSRDISKLADILGHSNIETTRIYLRSNSREYQKQLDSMGLVLEI